jgi:hypothetical protein
MWRCVVAETDNPNEYPYDEAPVETRPGKRGVNVFTLVVGLATLLASVYVLTDGAHFLPTFDFRWVLAGGAVLVGVLMLGTSFRSGRKR